jgi:hypothetical protein
MKANTLARHYGQLTAEERFGLILAADARGDKAEAERLVRAGQPITFSMPDHAPYVQAFDELALLIFIELQEEAARYMEAFARADEVQDIFGADDEANGAEGAEEEGQSVTEEQSDAKAGLESAEGDAGERPLGQRHLDLALAAGLVLRTKAEGWQRLCERRAIPPLGFWEGLPGFDRLQRALQWAEKAAFEPEGFLRWLNAIRPAGEPERAEVPRTAEGMAAAAEELFRQCVQRYGG